MGLTGFDEFNDDGDVIVVPADLPLLDTETLAGLLFDHRRVDAACTVLSAITADTAGRPLVRRDDRGRMAGIEADPVSARSAQNSGRRPAAGPVSPVETDLDGAGSEVSLGVYCFRRGLLAPAARRAAPSFGGPHDLAMIPAVLTQSGHVVQTSVMDGDPTNLRPVDDRRQLAEAESCLRRRTNDRWMDRGVTMIDPARTYVDSTVQLGIDVTLFPGTILQGTTVIGDGCEIGPDSRIDRSIIGANSTVAKTMARGARIGDHCTVGPFAVIEPGVELADGTVTGPFYAARTDSP